MGVLYVFSYSSIRAAAPVSAGERVDQLALLRRIVVRLRRVPSVSLRWW